MCGLVLPRARPVLMLVCLHVMCLCLPFFRTGYISEEEEEEDVFTKDHSRLMEETGGDEDEPANKEQELKQKQENEAKGVVSKQRRVMGGSDV